MEQTFPDSNKTEAQQPSRLWRVLRLIPMILMLLIIAILLVPFFMGGLLRITAWYLLQLIPPILGLISLIAVIIYAIVKRKFGRLLIATALIALLSLLPAILLIASIIAYPASLESTVPSATVRLPADVPLKVAWGGDELETNYHAAYPDQRWAYDLVVEPYNTGTTRLEDYGCYGIPVVAPVSGPVVIAHDGEPDAVPGALTNNLEAATGNYVVIQLETGTYLVIAHLKQGSITVGSGETVKEGQVIGQCGNSGNTSEPHIHIHHQRQDPNEFPISFAEGLPLYFRDHDGQPMPVGGVKIEEGVATFAGDTVQHIGR